MDTEGKNLKSDGQRKEKGEYTDLDILVTFR